MLSPAVHSSRVAAVTQCRKVAVRPVSFLVHGRKAGCPPYIIPSGRWWCGEECPRLNGRRGGEGAGAATPCLPGAGAAFFGAVSPVWCSSRRRPPQSRRSGLCTALSRTAASSPRVRFRRRPTPGQRHKEQKLFLRLAPPSAAPTPEEHSRRP
jgi:hypothetical protein